LNSIFLSIVIPAYNEEVRLPNTLAQVMDFIQQQPFDSEVIVVENGSTDCTLKIAQEFAARSSCFHIIHEGQRGKGLAVKRGMLQAQGEFCFMCDADLSMPVAKISAFLPPQLSDFDVAIASREFPGAQRYNEPFYRHLGGRAINLLIRTLALPGLQDTQCGFKCFRSDTANDLFSSLTLSGWSFDVEVLYVARLRGYRIVERPIPWYYNPQTKLSLFKDTLRMVMDIVKIRQNARQGEYTRRIN